MEAYGISAVLDGTHYPLVKDLWDTIDRECCPRSPVPHPYPHCTLAIAPTYDLDQLDTILRCLAAESQPFPIWTRGLALWNQGSGVYLKVARTAQLDQYRARVCRETAAATRPEPEWYQAMDFWEPHITLALGPQMRDKTPDIIRALYQRHLLWKIEVNNLTVVYEDDTHKELVGRYDFPNATDPAPPL